MQLSRIGPIALEGPLGDAEGNVLRGIHVERNLKLAVKLLPPSLLHQAMGGDTFAEDVKRLQKLVHPGVARVLGGAVDQGQPYLAIELVEGESLRQRLARLGRLPWETVVEIGDEICLALDYAHKAGVPHLRLTTGRVLLPKEGGVKLVGFDRSWTDRDEVLGLKTPLAEAHYYSQEVFRGKKSSVLPTCDLFALGVILYECLTGGPPWPVRNLVELVTVRRERAAPRVSASVLDCPVWLDVLVAKLLEVRRADRMQTAEETHRAFVAAKRKVAEGAGAAKQAWAGQKGTLTVDADRREINALRRKATVRTEKDDSPWYERAWFLAACLAVLVGVGAWSLWPASEEKLYSKAAPLMASENPVDWQAAQQLYLDELLERFPETDHRSEIDEFQRRFAIHRAEERIKNIERFGRKPETELERLYAEANRYEQFGDRLTAWQKYEAIEKLFPIDGLKDKLDQWAVAELARQGVGRIRAEAQSQLELTAVVEGKLSEARQLIDKGQLLPARQVLDAVVALYGGNQELAPLVEQARQLIRSLHDGAGSR
jgi:hypothetical protein